MHLSVVPIVPKNVVGVFVLKHCFRLVCCRRLCCSMMIPKSSKKAPKRLPNHRKRLPNPTQTLAKEPFWLLHRKRLKTIQKCVGQPCRQIDCRFGIKISNRKSIQSSLVVDDGDDHKELLLPTNWSGIFRRRRDDTFRKMFIDMIRYDKLRKLFIRCVCSRLHRRGISTRGLEWQNGRSILYPHEGVECQKNNLPRLSILIFMDQSVQGIGNGNETIVRYPGKKVP